MRPPRMNPRKIRKQETKYTINSDDDEWLVIVEWSMVYLWTLVIFLRGTKTSKWSRHILWSSIWRSHYRTIFYVDIKSFSCHVLISPRFFCVASSGIHVEYGVVPTTTEPDDSSSRQSLLSFVCATYRSRYTKYFCAYITSYLDRFFASFLLYLTWQKDSKYFRAGSSRPPMTLQMRMAYTAVQIFPKSVFGVIFPYPIVVPVTTLRWTAFE